MTGFESALFWTLGLMVPVWFWCVRKFRNLLRDRHPEKYDDMRLDEIWPRNLAGWFRDHDNHRPVFALMRFLFRREDRALDDPDVSGLTAFMLCFFCAYLGLFLLQTVLFFQHKAESPGSTAAVSAPRAEQERRNEAFNLHRAKKHDEAVRAYDRVLKDSERDAEVRYWRGMAHWQLLQPDRALEDFQRVIELEPTNFDAHVGADRIMSGQRRWDELLEMWDAYIARKPAHAEAYFERGGTNYHKGNMEAALADAAKACELGKAEACSLVKRLKGRT